MRNAGWIGALALVAFVPLAFVSGKPRADALSSGTDWPYYNGNPGNTHYSQLAEITTDNVHRLKVAWTYDTGDNDIPASEMQSNPLIVRGWLYFVSAKGRLICLDAGTGDERWVFDPAGGSAVYTRQRKRGVAYWSDGHIRRILFTFRNDLLAVDADTGRLASEFGVRGRVDLRAGLGRDPAAVSVSFNSPGSVYTDLIIVGSTGNAPGHIRAYDVRTGQQRWIFHTIPHPGEPGYDTWPKDAWNVANGANSWAGFAVDPERGIVFVPTASAGMLDKNMYGADRHGDNLFANSLVALDARTGKYLWHFQIVRHDLWDRDLPAPPTLVSVDRHGRRIDAVAQVTKSGHVFIFDRVTGKPLFPIEEHAAIASDVPGEKASARQPLPVKPAPFTRQHLTPELLTRRTPEARAAVQAQFSRLRSRGQFDPPSLQGTIIFPGTDGGAEWGGAAWDPETGLLYVNSNEMPWILKLKERPPAVAGDDGRALYLNRCASCHGEDRRGFPPEFPSLVDVGSRMPVEDLGVQIVRGSGRMPGATDLSMQQVLGLIRFLTGQDAAANSVPRKRKVESAGRRRGDAYIFEGYKKFLDPDGYPAVTPPWGTLSAIDLDTGEYAWKIPLGEYPELAAKGLTQTGSENYGGAVVTAGGVLFIAATVYDNKFRAFDKRTGKLLWETTLPAAGNATPATYHARGRQFVVICAGGGKNPTARPGGQIVAFAIPQA